MPVVSYCTCVFTLNSSSQEVWFPKTDVIKTCPQALDRQGLKPLFSLQLCENRKIQWCQWMNMFFQWKCSMNKTHTRRWGLVIVPESSTSSDRTETQMLISRLKASLSQSASASLSKRWCTWFTGEGPRGVICKDDGHGLPLGVTRQSCDILHITNLCHLCGNRRTNANSEVATEPSYSDILHLHHLERHLCSLNHLIYLSPSIAGCGSSAVKKGKWDR